MKGIETIKCDKKDCDYEDRRRNLKRVNGNNFCKKCYKENLKKKREILEKEINNTSKEQRQKEEEIVRKIKNNLVEKKINSQKESHAKYYEKNKEKLREHQRKKRLEKKKETETKTKEIIPQKIKGSKVKKVSKQFHNYLTREEKQLLFKKYLRKGLSSEEADLKVKRDVKHLQDLRDKLKDKKQSEEQLNMKFKEEFAKLLESE